MTSLQKQISLKPEDISIYSNKKHFNKVAQSKKASALITIKDFNARNEKNVNDNRDNNDNCTNCYCNDDDTETSIISEDYAIQFIKDSDNIGLNNFEQADAKNSIRKSINNDNFKTAFDTSSISDLNSSINISQVQEIQKDIIKNINDIISNDEEMKYNKDNKDKKRNSNISNDNESKKNTKSNNNNTNNYNGEFNNSTITTKANIKTSSRINGDVNEKNINNNNNKPNNNTANNNITSYNRIDPMNINSNNVYNNSNNAYFLNPQNSINSSNNTNYFSPLPSFPIYNNNQTIGFCNNMYSSSTHMNNQNSQNINTNFNNNMINYPYNTINMAQNTNNNICSYYTLPKNAILNNNTTNMNMINANIFNQPQQHLNYLNPTNQVNQIYIPINPNLQYNISNINGMSNIPINTYINTVGIKIPYSQSNINSNMQSNCSSSMISMVNNIQNNLSNLKNDCKKTSSDSILDSKSIYASNNSSLGSNKKENHSIYQISDSKSSSDVNANKTNNKIDCKGNNNNNNETKERNDKNTPDNTHSKSSNKKFKKITVDNLTEINVLHIIKSQNSTHSFLSKLEQNYNKQKKENIETLSTDNTAKDSNSNSDCSDKEANKDILNFSIFPQILNNLNSLTHNENGNYLLQKLIPKLNKENSTILFNYVKSNFENLSTHFLGTRIVQRVLENAEVSLLNTLVEEIKLHLAMLCHDYNGIHVVSKFMLHNNNNCEFIFDFLVNNFLSVSSDKEGCCLIQKVMQMTQHQDKIVSYYFNLMFLLL